MRSPGLSRMAHTRSFSVSDRSSEPTQPFGLAREFGFQRGRPFGLDVRVGGLLLHGHRHGTLPSSMPKL